MYIRTRLTLWFLLILALMLAAFSLTIYQLTRSNLLGWVEQDVRHQATLLRATIHPCPGAATLCVPPLDVFHSPEIYLQVQDPQGTVLASSGNLGKHRLPLMPAAIAADQVKEVPVDAMPLFVYCQPVVINHQLLGYLIVARSPQTIYYALTQLNHLFYLGVIVAFGLAGLAGWLLARQAMRPLEPPAPAAAETAVTKDHSPPLPPRKPPHDTARPHRL